MEKFIPFFKKTAAEIISFKLWSGSARLLLNNCLEIVRNTSPPLYTTTSLIYDDRLNNFFEYIFLLKIFYN
jgi:hypothetical protein